MTWLPGSMSARAKSSTGQQQQGLTGDSALMCHGRWMAGLEDPEYLPFHKRPEFRLFATDTFQQSITGVSFCYWAALSDLAGGWQSQSCQSTCHITRGQAVGLLQLIRCSRATQEWEAMSGQLFETWQVVGRLAWNGEATIPAIPQEARL